MLIASAEPGFWESVVVHMILHPHREPFGWQDMLIIAVVLLAVALLHEIPVIIMRRLFRSAGDAYAKANRLPPYDREDREPPRADPD